MYEIFYAAHKNITWQDHKEYVEFCDVGANIDANETEAHRERIV